MREQAIVGLVAGPHGWREQASGKQASKGTWVLWAAEIPCVPPEPSSEPTAPLTHIRVEKAKPGHGLFAGGRSKCEAQG